MTEPHEAARRAAEKLKWAGLIYCDLAVSSAQQIIADAHAELYAERDKVRENWLAEQKQRLENDNFSELYNAAKVKVQLETLRAERDELKAEVERLRRECRSALTQPSWETMKKAIKAIIEEQADADD